MISIDEHFEQRLFLWCAVISIAVLLRYAWTRFQRRQATICLPSKAPKVPTRLPLGLDFIAKMLRFNLRCQTLLLWDDIMRSKREASPTVEVNIGGIHTVMTADPENVKAILTTQFKDFGKGQRFNAIWHEFLGNGIFASDGHLWEDARSMIRGQFVRDRLEDTEFLERHTFQLLDVFENGGEEIDIKPYIFGYTLDIATDFLLGQSTDSLHHPDNEFTAAFAYVQKFHITLARMGSLGRLVPRKELRRRMKIFDAFIMPFVDEALAIPPNELKANHPTFLHAIAIQSRDPRYLRDQIASMLLAARDTTACTMCWMIYELSFAPELVKALRKEISDSVGMQRTPSFSELKSMRLLQNTIQETLRLYPVLPVNFREALENSTLPRGGGTTGSEPIGIPKGTVVVYGTQYMHLSPDRYDEKSPDPALFEPSRWEHWRPKNHTYIPFNAGPRICAGQQFAITELGHTMVAILQRFRSIEPRGDLLRCNPRQPPAPGSCSLPARVNQSRPRMLNAIVLQPADPMTFAFHE